MNFFRPYVCIKLCIICSKETSNVVRTCTVYLQHSYVTTIVVQIRNVKFVLTANVHVQHSNRKVILFVTCSEFFLSCHVIFTTLEPTWMLTVLNPTK